MTEIRELFAKLVREIRQYESDTFSASDSRITIKEAETIATHFIARAINDLIDTTTMDGCMITEELEEIREI